MERCLGIISTKNIDNDFGGLCNIRASYMLPFGGRYRVVDFMISNMVNHNIRTIALYTGNKLRSTMDHIGNGKPWDLNRRINGLFLFPPSYDLQAGPYLGDLSQFYNTIEFIQGIREKYVLFADPNIIAKVNLRKALRYFTDSNADITLIYREVNDSSGEMINYDKIHLDKEGNFTNLGENLGIEKCFKHFLGMAFIKKDVFIKIIVDAMEKGNIDYFRDSIMEYKNEYKINTYEFKGHVEVIRNLKSFYDANLNLLEKDVSQELFFEGGHILTKSKDEPSSLYTEESNVQNSLIANGCIIEGQVENSIIFRGVKIGKGAIVKNSIVMQKSEIGEKAIVVNTIMDKLTGVDRGIRITGSGLMPYVIEKYQKIKGD